MDVICGGLIESGHAGRPSRALQITTAGLLVPQGDIQLYVVHLKRCVWGCVFSGFTFVLFSIQTKEKTLEAYILEGCLLEITWKIVLLFVFLLLRNLESDMWNNTVSMAFILGIPPLIFLQLVHIIRFFGCMSIFDGFSCVFSHFFVISASNICWVNVSMPPLRIFSAPYSAFWLRLQAPIALFMQ